MVTIHGICSKGTIYCPRVPNLGELSQPSTPFGVGLVNSARWKIQDMDKIILLFNNYKNIFLNKCNSFKELYFIMYHL